MIALRSFALAAASASIVATLSPRARAADCTPPRILFVVDASASMLGQIAQTTKWQAAQDAVNAVLAAHATTAEWGLMLFPGAPGQCTTGEVVVDVGLGTESTISGALANLNIPGNAQTPAGQTLMAASQYGLITDPSYHDYVIFVTDGYQWCDVNGSTACVTQTDCSLMGVSPCPSCLPAQPDGCYCVQDWPVLGAQALSAAGVSTYVVGFGEQVNFKALNQTAVAGGTALPNCDPNSNQASCYFQASVPSELSAALSQIVLQLVTESCAGPCDIAGQRECTPTGWSDCDAPGSVSCTSSCDTPGTQQCVGGVLGECSSEASCNQGGAGGMASSSGSGGGGGGGGGGGLSGGTGGTGAPHAANGPGDEGSCACRTVALGASPRGTAGWLLLGLALAAGATRRRRGERRAAARRS